MARRYRYSLLCMASHEELYRMGQDGWGYWSVLSTDKGEMPYMLTWGQLHVLGHSLPGAWVRGHAVSEWITESSLCSGPNLARPSPRDWLWPRHWTVPPPHSTPHYRLLQFHMPLFREVPEWSVSGFISREVAHLVTNWAHSGHSTQQQYRNMQEKEKAIQVLVTVFPPCPPGSKPTCQYVA